MNQPIRTPPIPQRMVSQSGVLSLLPGATNLPSKPMMIPATITPIISMALPSVASRLRGSLFAVRSTRRPYPAR